ncbi:hypothetical protein ACFL4O_00455 [bacterium]
MKTKIHILTSFLIGMLCICKVSLFAEGGDIIINAGGTLTLNQGEIILIGSWTNSGTFTQSSVSTVTFTLDGTPSTSTFAGDTTFTILRSVDADKTLKFTAGSTQTITVDLIFGGESGSLMSLVSTSPGTKWYLDIQHGDETINYAYVKDAYSSSNYVSCFNSTDGGDNYRWFFDSAQAPSWNSPAHNTGYTFDTQPIFWFTSADRDSLTYPDAQIVFAEDSGFTVNVETFTYLNSSSGWQNVPTASIAIASYTLQADLTNSTGTKYVRTRFNDGHYGDGWSEWSSTRQIEIKDQASHWTTGSITAGVSAIRALHFTELRDTVIQLRYFRILSSGTWADGTGNFDTEVASGSAIRADHVLKLRTNLEGVYAEEGQSAPAWTSGTITSGAAIKADHITELRSKCELP